MDPLRRAAHNDDPEQRMVALIVLAYVGELADVDIIAPALGDEDVHVSEAATKALDILLPRYTSLNRQPATSRADAPGQPREEYRELPIMGLRLAASHGAVTARRAAVSIIRRHVDGPVVLEQMLESIWDQAAEVRYEAAFALRAFPEGESVAALIGATADSAESVVEAAVRSLEVLKASEAVPRLLELLERRTALRTVVSALGGIGEIRAIEHIARILQANSDEDRRAAAMALGKLRSVASVGHLIPALHDASPAVRSAALTSIRELQALGAFSLVSQLVFDDDGSVRRAAVLALERFGDPAAIPVLRVVSRQDQNLGIRTLAARVLAGLGAADAFSTISDLASTERQWRKLSRAVAELPWTAEIESELYERLDSREPRVRIGAVWTFGERGDVKAASAILPLLDVDDPPLQRAVAWSLGRMRASSAVPALRPICRHLDASVRADAAWALGECGDTEAVKDLIPLVYDSDDRVSRVAVHALGELRDPAGSAPLIAVSCDAEADVPIRLAATEALGHLRGEGALEALSRLVTDSEHPALRRAAASALQLQHDSSGVPPLTEASSDVDPTVREAAIVALVRLSPDDAFTKVSERIDDAEDTVRASAVALLIHYPYVMSAPHLHKASADRSPEVRAAAARAIGLIRHPGLLGILEYLNRDPAFVVQRAVVLALARVQPDRVHPLLIVAMGSRDARLREVVAMALAEIKHPDADAMLLTLAKDDDPRVREVSVEAWERKQPADER